MAENDGSTEQQGENILTPAQQREVVGILRNIAQAAEKRDQAEAEANAHIEAHVRMYEDPLASLTNKDIQAIENRLYGVLLSCSAIHELATDSIGDNFENAEHVLTAVKEMARANVKGLDACIERLTHRPASGAFAEELEIETE